MTAVQVPVWQSAVDSPPSDGDMLALGDGMVSYALGGHICAFNEGTGRKLWCAGHGTAPVRANDVIAFTAQDGSIVAVDGATGAERWRFKFPTSQAAAALSGPVLPVLERVWSTKRSFLVARQDGRGGRGAPNYGELSSSGSLIWSTELVGGIGTPFVVPPYALQLVTESGATLSKLMQVVGLGVHGGLRSAVLAWNILDVSLPQALVATDAATNEMQDHFLTFDVERVDVPSGAVVAHYHYAPDYEENAALYNANALSKGADSGEVRADAHWVLIALAGNLYRYRFAPAGTQRPLLVTRLTSLLGGPSAGAVYVTRRDGVWAIHAQVGAIYARRISLPGAAVSAFAIVGHTAYAGFGDGRVYGLDTISDRMVFNAKLACKPERFAMSVLRVYAVCPTPSGSRLFAFRRGSVR